MNQPEDNMQPKADIETEVYKHAQRILRSIYAKAMAGDVQAIKEYLDLVLGETEVCDDAEGA